MIKHFRTLISKKDSLKAYFVNMSFYFLATIITSFINLLINPFLAKNLSHNDYAIIGYFTSLSAFVAPLINFSIISYYSRNYFRFDEERKKIISDTIIVSILIIGLIGLILSLIFCFIFFKLNHVSFPFYPFALLAFTQVFFSSFFILFQVNLRMNRKAKEFFKITLFNSLILILLTVLFVIFIKGGAAGKMLAGLLSSIIIAAYSIKKVINKFHFDKAIFIDAINFCWPLTISGVLWFFLSGVDMFFLERLKDTHNMGLYSVAIQFSGFLFVFYTTLSKTFEPDIFKSIVERKFKRLFTIVASIVTINMIPVIIFIIFAPFVIKVFTYGRYSDAADFARILVLKNITSSLYYSLIIITVGFGFTKMELLIRVIGAILCIIMYSVLISQFQFYGAAWGQVLSFVIMSIVSASFLMFKLREKLKYI